ncbi:MAG: MnmA/TRMU family protein, partial [Alphaproteobacteria bacterium]
QSYFLFATTQEQLNMLRFPLGNRQKSETRELALKYGLAVADKPDSQDICFVPDGNYAKLVAKLRPDAAKSGDIVDMDGKVVGQHEGTIKYTIGQRRGIGVGGTAEPMYVVRIEPKKNQVVIGPKSALEKHVVYVKELNWLPQGAQEQDMKVQVKLRSNMSPVEATLKRTEGDRAELWLDLPAYGIAPGQAAVVYKGQRVLGGGWIEGAELVPN